MNNEDINLDHIQVACSDLSSRYEADFRCFEHGQAIWDCLLDYHIEIHRVLATSHIEQCDDVECIEDDHRDVIWEQKCRFCQDNPEEGEN